MADPADYYRILGVGRDATAEQIQRAYRRLARQLHPDMNKDPAAEDRFKEVSEAYDVLSDPEQRKRYDSLGRDFRRVTEGTDAGAWAGAGAGARRPRSSRTSREDRRTTGRTSTNAGGAGFDSIFDDLFGNRFGTVSGADQEFEVLLGLEDAYRGTRRKIQIGGDDGRTIDVTIPAGVRDGQRIRLSGQGGAGFGGGAPGDLYLVVRIAAGPKYRLDGRDVHVDLPLTPWEAALGMTVVVEAPDGEAKVRVPAGSSTGRLIRVAGRGLPNPSGKPGDLVAEVKIVVPSRLNAEERRLFEELSRVSNFDPRRSR
ncbi:MAG: Chaperone protein DnaJ [Acidimicrobiaceae bacterium]|jgi:curved DNA-binding protein|nr:Chaperone protein DnaJ [Acidimicrobiaceae bacterium]